MQFALAFGFLLDLFGDGLGHSMAFFVGWLYFTSFGFDPADGSGEVCAEGVVQSIFDEGDGIGDIFFVANFGVFCIWVVDGGMAFDGREVFVRALRGCSDQGHL